MAYTTIDDPSVYFQTLLYTGNGGSQTMTNDGNSDLQPDWVWIKQRSGTENHYLGNSSIANKFLNSDRTDSESTNISGKELTYNSDGFAFAGSDSTWNGSSSTYVAWQWKANGGSRTTFTESGNNPGGGRQVNTTAGFSIIDYTGTGTEGTVAHGLGAVPHVMIFRRRNIATDWTVYHHKNTSEPATDFLILNATDATQDVASVFNDTEPTSSVFTVHEAGKVNTDGDTFISYCFTEIQGYSKFGSYTGNGNADGPFVYTGFKPAWIMFKNTSTGDDQWTIVDNKRDIDNPTTHSLFPSGSNAEDDGTGNGYINVDFVSNGFKIRQITHMINASSENYIYMAFAESPFVSSEGVPTTAR